MATESSETLDHICESALLLEVTDMPGLTKLHTALEQIAESAEAEGRTDVAEYARQVSGTVENIILQDVDDPEAALKHTVNALGSIKNALMENTPLARNGANSQSGGGPYILPAHADADTLAEFLAAQKLMLEEWEEYVLAIDNGTEDAAPALKRLVHTLKGESGLLELEDVVTVCHSIEDEFQAREIGSMTDALLQIKDWLASAFHSYAAAHKPAEGAHSLLDRVLSQRDCKNASIPDSMEDHNSVEELEDETMELVAEVELVREFVAEANEHLENAEVHLLTMETDPANADAVNAIFRAFHTIKGTCGFLGLTEIQGLAHESENLLDKARKGQLVLEGSSLDVTFDAVDALKSMVQEVSNALSSGTGINRHPDLNSLVARVQAAQSGKPVPNKETASPPAATPKKRLGESLVESGNISQESLTVALETQKGMSEATLLGEDLVKFNIISRSQLDKALAVQEKEASKRLLGEILIDLEIATPKDIQYALVNLGNDPQATKLGNILVKCGLADAKDVANALRSQQTADPARSQKPVPVAEAVKVSADRLDHLVDIVGELVIAKSMVEQSATSLNGAAPTLRRDVGQLDKITRELQEIGMSLRMVPVRPTFQKMARLARDVAKKSGKPVQFVTQGEDTEIDKAIVDKIGDPLVHMIRNAVDHGLEASVEERIKAGKPEEGRVELRAFHKGGNIYIEVSDDGRGLNRDKILKKAIERGLASENDNLADREVWNLVFEPGFSTADQITDISGRGVGMDVVKKNIEALRAQVEIQSTPGKGSIFSIRLPLTLAIIEGMLVRVGEERLILPTLSILVLLKPRDGEISTVRNRGKLINHQNELIPLLHLGEFFGLPATTHDPKEGIVAVVEDEGKKIGLIVDEVIGQQQIVIKSLGAYLRNLPGIAGGAIMADGRVALIVDVNGLGKVWAQATRAA